MSDFFASLQTNIAAHFTVWGLSFVIAVVAYSIWHFAWTARRAGWLR